MSADLVLPVRKELALVPGFNHRGRPLPVYTVDAWLEDVFQQPVPTVPEPARQPIPRRDRSPITRAGRPRNPTLTTRCVRRISEHEAPSVALVFRCRSPLFAGLMATKRDTRKTPWQQRFWRFVPADRTLLDCWEWQGSVNENGYGTLGNDHGSTPKHHRAHRASYLIHYGEIPEGCVVCHRCDNRRCVNPAHLFAASQGENLSDMVRKGRAGAGMFRRGDQHPSQRFSDADVRAMRQLAADAIPYAEIGARFGIDRFYLSTLVRGRSRVSAGGPIRSDR